MAGPDDRRAPQKRIKARTLSMEELKSKIQTEMDGKDTPGPDQGTRVPDTIISDTEAKIKAATFASKEEEYREWERQLKEREAAVRKMEEEVQFSKRLVKLEEEELKVRRDSADKIIDKKIREALEKLESMKSTLEEKVRELARREEGLAEEEEELRKRDRILGTKERLFQESVTTTVEDRKRKKKDREEQLKEAYSKGNQAFRMGDHENALLWFDIILGLEPDREKVWYYKGMSLFKLKRYDQAIEAFDEVLERDPDDVDTLLAKAVCLRNMEFYANALSGFQNVISVDPDNALAIKNIRDLGQLIQIMMDKGEHIKSFESDGSASESQGEAEDPDRERTTIMPTRRSGMANDESIDESLGQDGGPGNGDGDMSVDSWDDFSSTTDLEVAPGLKETDVDAILARAEKVRNKGDTVDDDDIPMVATGELVVEETDVDPEPRPSKRPALKIPPRKKDISQPMKIERSSEKEPKNGAGNGKSPSGAVIGLPKRKVVSDDEDI